MRGQTITLTPEEAEDIYISLVCRLGVIETGRHSVRATEADKIGERVKALSSDQMRLVLRMEGIMNALLNGRR